MTGMWIGLGLALAGFFIGHSIENAAKSIAAALKPASDPLNGEAQ